MGRSEWGIRLRSKQDARDAFTALRQHNELGFADARGEDLEVNAVLRYKGGLWLAVGNGGGRDDSSRFLDAHLPAHIDVLWPFAKPDAWRECDDRVDLGGGSSARPSLAEALERLLALPELPEAAPPGDFVRHPY